MKTYKSITKTRTELELIHEICDCCGKEIKYCDDYDYYETGLFLKKGHNYPGWSWSETKQADICEDCFTEKLIPLLERELQITFYETESE